MDPFKFEDKRLIPNSQHKCFDFRGGFFCILNIFPFVIDFLSDFLFVKSDQTWLVWFPRHRYQDYYMKVIHQILRPCRLWSVPEIWVFGLQHQLAHTFFVALDRHISKLQFERRFGKIMLEFCFRAYLFGFAVKEWWSKMKQESNFCIVRIHASIWSSLLFHCEFIWAVLNV